MTARAPRDRVFTAVDLTGRYIGTRITLTPGQDDVPLDVAGRWRPVQQPPVTGVCTHVEHVGTCQGHRVHRVIVGVAGQRYVVTPYTTTVHVHTDDDSGVVRR